MARRRRRSTIYIGEKRWKVQRERISTHRGDCDITQRVIRADDRLQGEELLEVLAHEIIHARLWDIDEQAVLELGQAIARAAANEGLIRED
jgi:hypothetical protein